MLFLKPTLTSGVYGESFLTSGMLDIWGSQPSDRCTMNSFYGCLRQGTGSNLINPIMSARLEKKISNKKLKYSTRNFLDWEQQNLSPLFMGRLRLVQKCHLETGFGLLSGNATTLHIISSFHVKQGALNFVPAIMCIHRLLDEYPTNFHPYTQGCISTILPTVPFKQQKYQYWYNKIFFTKDEPRVWMFKKTS